MPAQMQHYIKYTYGGEGRLWSHQMFVWNPNTVQEPCANKTYTENADLRLGLVSSTTQKVLRMEESQTI